MIDYNPQDYKGCTKMQQSNLDIIAGYASYLLIALFVIYILANWH